MGAQAVADLLDAGVEVSLLGEGPAAEDRSLGQEEEKALAGGEAHERLAGCLCPIGLTAADVDPRREAGGEGDVVGRGEPLGQDRSLTASLQRLIGIAEEPERD